MVHPQGVLQLPSLAKLRHSTMQNICNQGRKLKVWTRRWRIWLMQNFLLNTIEDQFTFLKDPSLHFRWNISYSIKERKTNSKFTMIWSVVICNWKDRYAEKRNVHREWCMRVHISFTDAPRGTTQGSWRPRAISSLFLLDRHCILLLLHRYCKITTRDWWNV